MLEMLQFTSNLIDMDQSHRTDQQMKDFEQTEVNNGRKGIHVQKLMLLTTLFNSKEIKT